MPFGLIPSVENAVSGTIRFILACFVMLSHLPNTWMRLHLGVVSVICFYFISVYLMRKSYTRFCRHSQNPILSFYMDRIIKLFPQYLIIVFLTFIAIFYLGRSDSIPWLNQDITVLKILLNALLLPVNYVFDPFVIEALKPHPIVPPAWSLATEFHFYLLLPLIFLLNSKNFLMLLILNFGIQLCSFFFSVPGFDLSNFSYRYILGVLTIFLYGYSYAGMDQDLFKCITYSIWIAFFLLLLGIMLFLNEVSQSLAKEVLTGGVISLPLGYLYRRVQIKKKKIKVLDELLGNLAYPIFISHILSFYLTERLMKIPCAVLTLNRFYISSIAISLILSFFLYAIQKKIEIFRIKVRGFGSLKRHGL